MTPLPGGGSLVSAGQWSEQAATTINMPAIRPDMPPPAPYRAAPAPLAPAPTPQRRAQTHTIHEPSPQEVVRRRREARETDPPTGRGGGRSGRLAALVAAAVLLPAVAWGSIALARDGTTMAIGSSARSAAERIPSPTGTPTVDAEAAVPPTTASPATRPSSSVPASALASPGGLPPECASGDPGRGRADSADGTVSGGGLSFPTVAGYRVPSTAYVMSWANGATGQSRTVAQGWESWFGVGTLDEPTTSAAEAARMVTRCLSSAALVGRVTDTSTVTDRATTVDGHDAWMIRTQLHVDELAPVAGDQITVVAVDTGREALSVFADAVPLDDPQALDLADQVQEKLAVTG